MKGFSWMVSNGKTAIVTGANRGIGFETVKKLAVEGYNVAARVRSLNKDIKTLIENPVYAGQEHRIFEIDFDAKGINRFLKSNRYSIGQNYRCFSK